jgi:hypothetical protein
LKEHFKDAVEWMVQRKINPGFAANDPIYRQAFAKLEPQPRHLAEGKFISSTWKAPFVRALKARPEMEVSSLGIDEEGADGCEACGRGKHPAKFEVFFKGKPYKHSTLDDIDPDSDSDEDSDSDSSSDSSISESQSVNSVGARLPPTTKAFRVGSSCCANAEIAHELLHWKHALNQFIECELESEGYLTGEKLKERLKWSERKKRKYANDIVDKWVLEGKIKGLYADFKQHIDKAETAQTNQWGRGAR